MIHWLPLAEEEQMARFDLSDTEWALIKPLLPNKPRGVARVNDWRVLNGIFYVLRTGSPWRDLPERYGPYTTVYNASTAGRRRVSGCMSSRRWRPNRTIRWRLLTVRSSALTSTPPAEKRGRRSRHRPFSWRAEHQDQRPGG
jgi:transposase